MNGKRIVEDGKKTVEAGVTMVGAGVSAVSKGGKEAIDWLRRRTPITFTRTQYQVGNAPGILVEDRVSPAPVIDITAYGPDACDRTEAATMEQVKQAMGSQPVVWVNVVGLGDTEIIYEIGRLFSLHPLVVEDIGNAGQRAKTEYHDSHLFTVARMITLSDAFELSSEQLSIVIGRGFVLTVQEHAGDCLNPVRQRIEKSIGRIRSVGADYLAYAILDAVVDHYFPVLERYGEQIEQLEDEAMIRPTRSTVAGIYSIRRDLLALRRSVWPLREAINSLIRQGEGHLSSDTVRYLQDCYDHIVRSVDILEIYRELTSGLMELYLSGVGLQQNEVMKVLTIIATIFIPLTFIAGIYGMNFDPDTSPWNMPELGWYWGYPIALSAMAALAVGMLVYFRRRKWF